MDMTRGTGSCIMSRPKVGCLDDSGANVPPPISLAVSKFPSCFLFSFWLRELVCREMTQIVRLSAMLL